MAWWAWSEGWVGLVEGDFCEWSRIGGRGLNGCGLKGAGLKWAGLEWVDVGCEG